MKRTLGGAWELTLRCYWGWPVLGGVVTVLLVNSILYPHLKGLQARSGPTKPTAWIQAGFKDFAQGQFDDGGSNLYVNANGIIEMINNWNVNNDGYPDLVLANSHDY